ncbi:hypothetical protein AB1K18_17775 [Peribacillus simplex]|nr:hypothetical protein [Peribacillus sp. NJ4]
MRYYIQVNQVSADEQRGITLKVDIPFIVQAAREILDLRIYPLNG